MGWWSADILGGDTTYDGVAAVWDRALELGGHPDKNYGDWVLDQEESSFDFDRDILRECFTPENVVKIFREFQAIERGWDVPVIYTQILAAMLIGSGTPIPEEIKADMISMIASDDWATENQERAMYVLDLVRRVESHKGGDKHELPQKGLMETMGEFLGGIEKRNPADDGMVLRPEEVKEAQSILSTLKHG